MLLYLLVTLTGLLIFGLMSYGALHYALLQGKKTHLIGREDRLMSLLKENAMRHTRSSLNDQLQQYALVTHEGNLFHVHDMNGNILFPVGGAEDMWSLPSAEACQQRRFTAVRSHNQPILVMCHQEFLNGRLVCLHFGGSLEEEDFILHEYRSVLLFLLPALILLSSLSGYFLSRFALLPVHRMTQAALDIGIGNLSRRLPIPQAKDEIQQLALAWNQLLAQLDAAVGRLSEFSADASHDIRTSITVILASAQLSLQRPRMESEYREVLEKIVAECRTASTLLDALLSMARSENFTHEVVLQKINLSDLAIQGCRRVEDLAESCGLMLDWKLSSSEVYVNGDELLLQRALGILLDNAIRYTPAGGQVWVEVAEEAQGVTITVRDTGVGMTENVRQHVFDRFYQADLRERKTAAGSGLGLSIARWIATAHKAYLSVESTPMQGAAFHIYFPIEGSGKVDELS